MLLRSTLITLLACMLSVSLLAQETWSLEKCIRYAQQNSLTMKQAQYNIRNAELTAKQSKFERLPNLNASSGAGYQFGRTIDPATNEFGTQRIGYHTISANTNVVVYAGNQINNSIKQSQLDLEASKLDADFSSNSIALNVALAYLNILLAEEQLENAKKNLELSQEQLDNTDKLIQAGSLPVNDRLDFVAQIALNEQQIIESQNSVDINYLNLKQLLELDPNLDIQIERPEVPVPTYADPASYSLGEIYTSALGTQPQIKAADLRYESALIGEKISKASLLPSLVAFGSISSNYSSLFLDQFNPSIENIRTVENTIDVGIDGQIVPVTFFNEEFDISFPKLSYGDQIKDNFGQSVGISLNIPIYNRQRNSTAVERARINTLNQEVINSQTRQQLKTDIQRAIADARAAKESYEASQTSLEAAQAAFENAQRRFDLGAINTLEFTTARNNLDRAQLTLIQAKYRYLFNVKVVEFYQGKTISLN